MILDKKLRAGAAIVCALAVSLGSCSPHPDSSEQVGHAGKLIAICTISTLCSLVSSVGGNRADVRGIVPVGVSPETYEPTPDDLVTISRARVLFENGSGLESWLEKVLRSASAPALTRVVFSDAIPPAERSSGNPHLWLDPAFAKTYVTVIDQSLSNADPANARAYNENAMREIVLLSNLDHWVRGQIASIPASRRSMICFHDAWYYFDRRYGIKNVGAVEPSPGQEPSPGYFARLIALAKANHVRAVFTEPQFSPKLAEALARGAGIRTVSNLYDDTLGTSPQLSNYEGMLRYDVSTIVEALKS